MSLTSGIGGERRRRVLNEQVITSASSTSSTGGGKSTRADSPSYEAGALEGQPAIVSLVPRSYLTIAGLFLVGSLAVAGLETLHSHVKDWADIIAPEHAAALDLNGPASLASWFAATLLLAAALGSLVIYSLRRHKVDDYRGRYRIWLPLAACWLLLSVNTVARLHPVLADVLVQLSGRTIWGNGAFWWLAPAAVLWAVITLRLAIEIRHAKLALVTLLLAAACPAVVQAVQLGWLTAVAPELESVFIGTVGLAGHVLLLTALGLYARHVVLDAGGQLPARPRRSKKKEKPSKKTASESTANRTNYKRGRKLKIDAAHQSGTRPAGRSDLDTKPSQSSKSQTEWTDGSDADEERDYDEHTGQRKMTKAERKRLRKLKQKQRARH